MSKCETSQGRDAIPLSLGTVANLEQETSAALREPYQEAQQAA
jgi:hypothetical protein